MRSHSRCKLTSKVHTYHQLEHFNWMDISTRCGNSQEDAVVLTDNGGFVRQRSESCRAATRRARHGTRQAVAILAL